MRGRRSRAETAAQVHDILAASPFPLGAYEVLQRLRERGRCDPPTVYRALAWLTRRGQAHRLETLKAYVVRKVAPDRASNLSRDTSTLFIVYDSCRSVREIADPDLDSRFSRCTAAEMFEPRTGTIEILGLCVRCRNGRSEAEGQDRPGTAARGVDRPGVGK